MPAPAVRTLLSCAVLLFLGACGARESAPSADDATSPPAESAAPLETASEPGPDGLPAQTPAAKRSPDQAGEPLLAYRAVGTEPFWSVRTEGDRLLFTTPENQTGTQLTGTHTLRADGIHYVGSDGGTAFELDIERGQCSDGMSDTVYTYTATFRYGQTEYTGCAEQAKAK